MKKIIHSIFTLSILWAAKSHATPFFGVNDVHQGGVTFTSEAPLADSNYLQAASGDFNGDGKLDIAVGDSRWYVSAKGEQRGRVYLFLSQPEVLDDPNTPENEYDDGTVKSIEVSQADYVFVGKYTVKGSAKAGDQLGSSLAFVDLNQDGFSDLMMGAPQYSLNTTAYKVGAVIILQGQAQLPVANAPVVIDQAILNQQFTGHVVTGATSQSASNTLGGIVANVGDFTADGHDDLAISASSEKKPGTTNSVGAVYIWPSRAGFYFSADVGTTLALTDPLARQFVMSQSLVAGFGAFRFLGANTGDGVSSIAQNGDVDGDGIGDLMIGSEAALYNIPVRGSTGAITPNKFTKVNDAGVSYLIYGKESIAAGTYELAKLVDRTDTRFDAALFYEEATVVTNFGHAVTFLKDQNQDGRDELVIAADKHKSVTGTSTVGYVYIVSPGSTRFLGAQAVWVKTNTQPNLAQVILGGNISSINLGHSLAQADFDGNGVNDLLIGSETSGTAGEGAAIVLYDDIISLVPTEIDAAVSATNGNESFYTLDPWHLNTIDKGVWFEGDNKSNRLDRTGVVVANLGDINQDGIDDIFIVSPGSAVDELGRTLAMQPLSYPAKADLIFGRN